LLGFALEEGQEMTIVLAGLYLYPCLVLWLMQHGLCRAHLLLEHLVHKIQTENRRSNTSTSFVMASDEDNFDIDIYGDGEIDMGNDGNMDYKQEDEEASFAVDAEHVHLAEETAETKADPEQKPTPAHAPPSQVKTEEAQPNGGEAADKPTPAPTQGVKRKETSDERPVDHGATNALMISDLHWWITEDDIRGWVNEAGAEDELREITFSEHKVNGKSKGSVWLSQPRIGGLTQYQTSISRNFFTSSSNCNQARNRISRRHSG
jgi:hypothetical protein